jgi:hypothetical protein
VNKNNEFDLKQPELKPEEFYKSDDWACMARYDSTGSYVIARHRPTGLELQFSAWDAAGFGDALTFAAREADKAWNKQILENGRA